MCVWGGKRKHVLWDLFLLQPLKADKFSSVHSNLLVDLRGLGEGGGEALPEVT